MTRDSIQAAAGHPFIVHATKIATGAMLATLLSGCSLISFEVERDIPEQRVRGNLVSMLLDGVLENPIPMDIDLEQETAAQDTVVHHHGHRCRRGRRRQLRLHRCGHLARRERERR